MSDIPGDRITHINYEFANIGWDGRIAIGDSWADKEKTFNSDTWDQPLRGNFNQFIKFTHTHFRWWLSNYLFIDFIFHTIISLLFLLQTWSRQFSDIAWNDQTRSKFAVSCIEFIQKYGFDGIDSDWQVNITKHGILKIH